MNTLPKNPNDLKILKQVIPVTPFNSILSSSHSIKTPPHVISKTPIVLSGEDDDKYKAEAESTQSSDNDNDNDNDNDRTRPYIIKQPVFSSYQPHLSASSQPLPPPQPIVNCISVSEHISTCPVCSQLYKQCNIVRNAFMLCTIVLSISFVMLITHTNKN